MSAAARSDRPAGGVRVELWRSVAVYRLATVAVDVYLIIRWQHLYRHAGPAVAAAVAMTVWTFLLGWLAVTGRAHRWTVVSADVVITAALTLMSIGAQTATQRHGTMPTLTTLWAAGPALEAGILAGSVAGMLIGVVQFAVAVIVRAGWDGRTLGSGVLLVVAGGVAGYVAVLTARAERELATAVATQASIAERERLARSVHDGALQVLALVARTGREQDGRWRALGEAAATQEAALRALLASPTPPPDPSLTDLSAELRGLASEQATVSLPATAVSLPRAQASEIRAAVAAALDNVSRHAGPTAHAWVLVEDLGSEVHVTVRDDGRGMSDDRLAEAQREGRLGVSASIRGRITGLGGAVSVTSAPGAGVRVQMTVPRQDVQ